MAQSSQSTPTVMANIGGTNHQVNLRDYLNMRVAPFVKKAITESLDAAPEYPLQWLGENLIHQSMLYEGNPDSTNIRERFLYSFETPTAAPAPATPTVETSPQTEPAAAATQTSMEGIPNSAPTVNGSAATEPLPTQDVQMSQHTSGENESAQGQEVEGSRDTEMSETS